MESARQCLSAWSMADSWPTLDGWRPGCGLLIVQEHDLAGMEARSTSTPEFYDAGQTEAPKEASCRLVLRPGPARRRVLAWRCTAGKEQSAPESPRAGCVPGTACLGRCPATWQCCGGDSPTGHQQRPSCSWAASPALVCSYLSSAGLQTASHRLHHHAACGNTPHRVGWPGQRSCHARRWDEGAQG